MPVLPPENGAPGTARGLVPPSARVPAEPGLAAGTAGDGAPLTWGSDAPAPALPERRRDMRSARGAGSGGS